jgi:PAS domain-containing protein
MAIFLHFRKSNVHLIACGATLLAFLITKFGGAASGHEKLILLVAAAAGSASLGGWVTGLASIMQSALLFALFLARPFGSLMIEDPSDRFRLIVFLAVAIGIVFLFATRHRALLALRSREEFLAQALSTGRTRAWMADLKNGIFQESSITPADGEVSTAPGSPFPPCMGYDAFIAAIHPEDRHAFLHAVSRAIHDTRTGEINHRISQADGQYQWMNTRLRVHFNPSGQAVRLIGVSISN